MDDKISVRAELIYKDPAAALEWLAKAFGFETRIIVKDPEGRIVFSESGIGEHTVGIVSTVLAGTASPLDVDGLNTQVVQIRFSADLEAHCTQARAAGAEILAEPQTHFFGEKSYVARDLEGHIWTFGQRIAGAGGPSPPGWTVSFPGTGAAGGRCRKA